MSRFKNILMWIVMVLVIIMLAANMVLTLYLSNQQTEATNERIEDVIKLIPSSPKVINGIDGKTPVFGVDYFNGRDGKDSFSTHTFEKETVIKEVPVNGKDGDTPELKCNLVKNRWEVRYDESDSWRVLREPTKCTVTKDDILEVLEEIL